MVMTTLFTLSTNPPSELATSFSYEFLNPELITFGSINPKPKTSKSKDLESNQIGPASPDLVSPISANFPTKKKEPEFLILL